MARGVIDVDYDIRGDMLRAWGPVVVDDHVGVKEGADICPTEGGATKGAEVKRAVREQLAQPIEMAPVDRLSIAKMRFRIWSEASLIVAPFYSLWEDAHHWCS